MFVATLDTGNYSFMSLGETQREATRVLSEAWTLHKQQTGSPLDWYDLDVNVYELQPGQALRDGTPIYPEQRA